jgi:predicted DCC family thiol-disulfide oxidoreductase YuxK
MEHSPAAIAILYDGECYFCRHYTRLLRLRERGYSVELINAREPHALLQDAAARGLDLHRGMVVYHGKDIYYGAEALTHLASLEHGVGGAWLHIHRTLFKRARISRHLYPLLLNIRLASLAIKGVARLNAEK